MLFNSSISSCISLATEFINLVFGRRFVFQVLHQYFHTMFTAGMNIRSVLTSAIYSKASLFYTSSKNKFSL